MSSNPTKPAVPVAAKKRLPKEERNRQLMDVAWSIVRGEGTDALTTIQQKISITALESLVEDTQAAKDHEATINDILAATDCQKCICDALPGVCGKH